MNIPKVFYALSSRAEKSGKLTETDIENYVSSLKEDTTFLPELISIVGPELFLKIVKDLGGMKIVLPSPEKVVRAIRLNKEKTDE